MPSSVVKSFASKSGKSEEDVEKMWNDVKSSVFSEPKYKKMDDSSRYKIVVGILKKNLKINESTLDKLNEFLNWKEIIKELN